MVSGSPGVFECGLVSQQRCTGSLACKSRLQQGCVDRRKIHWGYCVGIYLVSTWKQSSPKDLLDCCLRSWTNRCCSTIRIACRSLRGSMCCYCSNSGETCRFGLVVSMMRCLWLCSLSRYIEHRLACLFFQCLSLNLTTICWLHAIIEEFHGSLTVVVAAGKDYSSWDCCCYSRRYCLNYCFGYFDFYSLHDSGCCFMNAAYVVIDLKVVAVIAILSVRIIVCAECVKSDSGLGVRFTAISLIDVALRRSVACSESRSEFDLAACAACGGCYACCDCGYHHMISSVGYHWNLLRFTREKFARKGVID